MIDETKKMFQGLGNEVIVNKDITHDIEKYTDFKKEIVTILDMYRNGNWGECTDKNSKKNNDKSFKAKKGYITAVYKTSIFPLSIISYDDLKVTKIKYIR